MILPTTYTATLLILFLSMLFWGSWANTQKAAGKWRFELYYFDYAFGTLLVALLLALTFGSMGDNLTFEDNIAISGKRQMAMAAGAGAIFNLGNMLLVAAITLAGMSVAFPISIGLALVIGVVWNYALKPQGNPALLFSGAALVAAAIVVNALAHRRNTLAKATGKKNASGGTKGIVLSLASGVLMGSFYPLVEQSKAGDIGLGAYAAAVFFSIGIVLSTFLYNLYFMNLPVQGDAVSFKQYFKGTLGQHAWGLLGGGLWCAGTVANFVAASAPREVNVGPAISFAIGQGATLISALWGLILWKEFAGANGAVKRLIAIMLVLFVAGLALVSLAPLN